MKTIIGIAIFVFTAAAYSQDQKYVKVDFSEVRKAVSDNAGPFYYPKLMERYIKNDTTLTLEEYRYLYYGYTFQKNYDPYWHSKQQEELDAVYKKDTLSVSDCDTIIKYAALSIEDNPFDLREIKTLSYAYHFKGDDTTALKYYLRRSGIIDAILSTGDGTGCESGYCVIYVSDEYEILRIYKLNFKKQWVTEGNRCDCLAGENPEGNTEQIYFDIQRMMEVEAGLFNK
jgi:hypothetical protein